MEHPWVVKLRCGNSFGAGVILSAFTVLTARHVVDPEGRTLCGQTADAEFVRVFHADSLGELSGDSLVFPAANDIDLALVQIREPKRFPVARRCPVRQDASHGINVGDEVTFHGFDRDVGDVQPMKRRIVEVHGRAGAYVCDGSIPCGFSGGPVTSEGALVGISYARDHDQGQSYFYGGSALSDMLSVVPSESLNWSMSTVHHLRRFPLGPGIPSMRSTSGLPKFIRACQRLFAGKKAIEAIALANAARIECGPDPFQRGLIDVSDLPDPHFALHGFWMGAVIEAGLKSPRMLAALLESVDTESLDSGAREEKNRMLAYLVKPD